MTDTPKSVFLADDHPLYLKGLHDLIASDPQFVVAGDATTGRQALEGISRLRPDIAVIDIDMPGMDGLEVARTVRDTSPMTRVLILTMHNAEDLFNEALDIGVRGYILKENAVTDILRAIQTIADGGTFISPTLSTLRFARARNTTAARNGHPVLSTLSPTQKRILRMISENKTSKEIAGILGISFRTVESHRTNIAVRLGLTGSHSLLKFAFDHKSALSDFVTE
jgi:two-component system response regulator DegU